jgi:hypothetical protein
VEFLARHLSPVRVFTLSVCVAILWGYNAHLNRYITPERGLGYALGIVGGSMMLLLLLYPARKRLPWLNVIGNVTGWFRIHMIFGVLGPLIVLFHSDFSLGATNSNVALACMLLVAGSGLIGRYFYGRVYGDWTDHKATLSELQATAEQLRKQSTTVSVLPDLLAVIEAEEQRLFRPSRTPIGAVLRPITIGLRSMLARWRLERAIHRMVVQAARQSPTLAAHGARLAATALGYATRRLDANRLVAEHRIYVKLLSLWHFAHVPSFIMLLVAGTVHVIAVHVY